MKKIPPAFMVSGIAYGPNEVDQLRTALVKKADHDVKTSLTESVLIFQAVALLLHMSEHIWGDFLKEEVDHETSNIQGNKSSSRPSERDVRHGTPGLVE